MLIPKASSLLIHQHQHTASQIISDIICWCTRSRDKSVESIWLDTVLIYMLTQRFKPPTCWASGRVYTHELIRIRVTSNHRSRNRKNMSSSISRTPASRDSTTCSICLKRLRCSKIGKPDACNHIFCYTCILEWAKVIINSMVWYYLQKSSPHMYYAECEHLSCGPY